MGAQLVMVASFLNKILTNYWLQMFALKVLMQKVLLQMVVLVLGLFAKLLVQQPLLISMYVQLVMATSFLPKVFTKYMLQSFALKVLQKVLLLMGAEGLLAKSLVQMPLLRSMCAQLVMNTSFLTKVFKKYMHHIFALKCLQKVLLQLSFLLLFLGQLVTVASFLNKIIKKYRLQELALKLLLVQKVLLQMVVFVRPFAKSLVQLPLLLSTQLVMIASFLTKVFTKWVLQMFALKGLQQVLHA